MSSLYQYSTEGLKGWYLHLVMPGEETSLCGRPLTDMVESHRQQLHCEQCQHEAMLQYYSAGYDVFWHEDTGRLTLRTIELHDGITIDEFITPGTAVHYQVSVNGEARFNHHSTLEAAVLEAAFINHPHGGELYSIALSLLKGD